MAPVAPSCGFATDCFPKYTLAHVNVSAARWGVCDMRARRQAAEYKSLHEQAVATCTAVAGRFMPTGAYCLPETLRNATFGKPRRRRISLPNGQSYAIPFDPTYETPTHYEPDSHVVERLLQMLTSPRFTTGTRQSIIDFGAGVGQCKHTMLKRGVVAQRLLDARR